jgi:sRNA-binding protein
MSKTLQDLVATLRDRFPAAFSLKRAQPLKVGIGNEIAKRLDVNPRAVGLALGFYCNRSAYLSACKEGATRVDLDGNPAGTVIERDAAHAEKLLEERWAIWRTKREARLAPQVEAKGREGLMQARAEHEAPQLRQAEFARNALAGSLGKRRSRGPSPLLWSGSVDLASLCAVSSHPVRECRRSGAFARPRENLACAPEPAPQAATPPHRR